MFVDDTTERLLGKVSLFAEDTKVCNKINIIGGICKMENYVVLLENLSKM